MSLKSIYMGLLTSLIFSASITSAAVLTLNSGEKDIEGVKLAKSADMSTEKSKGSLEFLGAGLRSKKVVFVNVKVYVGQFFVQQASSFQKSNALDSIDQQKAVAMTLTFVRDVEAKQVQGSFKESFEVNSVDLKDAQISQLMDAVMKGGNANKGSHLSMIGTKNDDKTETVTYESPTGQVTSITGPEGLRRKVFSLWFGKAADGGVSDFAKAILQ